MRKNKRPARQSAPSLPESATTQNRHTVIAMRQRLEALLEAEITLSLIVHDELMSLGARANARQLLRLQVADPFRGVCTVGRPMSLPSQGISLPAAARLFRILSVWDQGSERTRRALELTLQHCPVATVPASRT